MSLSLHSSTEALTSAKRGSEKDRDIDPETSSMGESSARMSSRPPVTAVSPRSAARSRQPCEPINHAKESVCKSRRPGTSRGSRIFAKETLFGAPGIPATALVWLETAKMRPSSTSRGPLLLVRPPLLLLLHVGRISWSRPERRLATENAPGGDNFSCEIERWTGGSQRNVQTYTQNPQMSSRARKIAPDPGAGRALASHAHR